MLQVLYDEINKVFFVEVNVQFISSVALWADLNLHQLPPLLLAQVLMSSQQMRKGSARPGEYRTRKNSS